MGRRLSNLRGATKAIAAITGAVVAAGGGGCSFLFSEGAPADHQRLAYFDCGESWAPPVLDTIASGLFALTATRGRQEDSAKVANPDAALAVDIGFAALAAASAVFGYHAVGDCTAARKERAARAWQARALPPPYGLPPGGEPPRLWPPSFPPPR